MKTFLIFFLVVFSAKFAFAQDSLDFEPRRNTFKLDLTHTLIYKNAFNLSLERLTKKNQSLAITAGYQEFPKMLSLGENIEGKREDQSGGYKFGGEYRFYLQKENKYSAPRGIYVGPFFSVLGFKSQRDIVYDGDEEPEEARFDSRIHLFSFGAELGYQFVFNDRWSLDLVLVGPSFTRYNAKMNLEGDFEFDPEDVQNEILEAMIDKFPGLEDLLNDKELDSSGNVDTWGIGYRYQVLIGYRFGKKFKKN